MLFADTLILMRGGGDLATGAAIRLVRAGFPLIITELAQPLAVRRAVSLARAVTEGEAEVEGVFARRAATSEEAQSLAAEALVPVLVDPAGNAIRELAPRVLVDARLKKRDIETHMGDAGLVVGLGPGFTAGLNCHAVVETNRGHFLGRVYWNGRAESDTGMPDKVDGQDALRVLRAPRNGVVQVQTEIGASVVRNQLIASVEGEAVLAPFAGVLRGLIAQSTAVTAGVKIGDIDPRGRRTHCFTVSEKALAVGGGVLEAVLTWINREQQRR